MIKIPTTSLSTMATMAIFPSPLPFPLPPPAASGADESPSLGRDGLDDGIASGEQGFLSGGPQRPGLPTNAVGPRFSSAPFCGIGPERLL